MTDTDAAEKLAWVRRRLAALDKIEERLLEMRELAEYARTRVLSAEAARALNERLAQCSREMEQVDRESRRFWLENH